MAKQSGARAITLIPGNGDDNFFGSFGDDVINALAGDDIVVGLSGNDQIFGSAGNDQLFGVDGDDLLDGGSGDDRLTGSTPIPGPPDFSRAQDVLTGGRGTDTFVLGAGPLVFYAVQGDSDYALITDFSLARDVLELPDVFASGFSVGAAPSAIAEGTGIFFNDDLVAVLADIEPDQFSLDSAHVVLV